MLLACFVNRWFVGKMGVYPFVLVWFMGIVILLFIQPDYTLSLIVVCCVIMYHLRIFCLNLHWVMMGFARFWGLEIGDWSF